jgi:hypothetical protein
MCPKTIHIETVSRDSSGTRYQVTIRLELVDDRNVLHTYDAILDPYINFNILGVPFFEDFFGDQILSHDAVVEADGTCIASSSCRSHFVWDYGEHICHFNHLHSNLPELLLYSRVGYFQTFCTRILCFYNKTVAYPFSPAYTIAPEINPAAVSDTD